MKLFVFKIYALYLSYIYYLVNHFCDCFHYLLCHSKHDIMAACSRGAFGLWYLYSAERVHKIGAHTNGHTNGASWHVEINEWSTSRNDTVVSIAYII